MHQRCIRLHRFQHVDHRGQRLPLDLHQFQGILCYITAFRRYRHHRFTGVAHFFHRNRVFHHRLGAEGGDRIDDFGRLTPGQYCIDPGQLSGRAGIDADNAGVGVGTAQHGRVEHPRKVYVVGVDGCAHEQRRVFAPLDVLADPCALIGCSRHGLFLL